MQSLPPATERFYITFEGTIKLISELNRSCYVKGYKQVAPGLVVMAEKYLSGLDRTVLIESFIEKSHIYWEQIRLKNEDFFMKSAKEIFGDIPLVDLPSALTNLFSGVDEKGNRIIPKEDRDALFSFFSSMVKICIKHIHEERGPVAVNRYTKKYKEHINIKEQSGLWKIQLTWPSST